MVVHIYCSNITVGLLTISGFNNGDNDGTYTCSPTSTFPTVPPGDTVTLARGEYFSLSTGRDLHGKLPVILKTTGFIQKNQCTHKCIGTAVIMLYHEKQKCDLK